MTAKKKWEKEKAVTSLPAGEPQTLDPPIINPKGSEGWGERGMEARRMEKLNDQ